MLSSSLISVQVIPYRRFRLTLRRRSTNNHPNVILLAQRGFADHATLQRAIFYILLRRQGESNPKESITRYGRLDKIMLPCSTLTIQVAGRSSYSSHALLLTFGKPFKSPLQLNPSYFVSKSSSTLTRRVQGYFWVLGPFLAADADLCGCVSDDLQAGGTTTSDHDFSCPPFDCNSTASLCPHHESAHLRP